MGIKISDMTAAGAVAGPELIPASVSGAPRSVTPANVKNYTIDQIEALAAAGAVTGADSVYILQGGVLKPVDIDVVAQHAIDAIWGKAAEVAPDGADVLALKDGGVTEKTVTLALLAEYVRASIEAAVLDVSDLADGSGTIAVTDYMLVTQGTTAKRVQLSDINSAIYAGLAAHVTGKTAIGSTDDADVFYVVRGGTPYKMTLAQVATHAAASAMITGSGTAGFMAEWVDASTLKAGMAVATSSTGFTAGNDTSIPTTKAVRDEMDTVINDATDIGADLVSTDTILVDDGAAGTQRKAALSRVANLIGSTIINDSTDIGADIVPTDTILVDDGAAGTQRKSAVSRLAKPIGLTVINDQADIGADLVGTDTILVDDGAAGTGRKSAISRLTKPLGLALINDQADIGADLVSTDTILVDDGAAGVGRKAALSRVTKLARDGLINDQADIAADLVSTDTILVDDGAAGTQRKSAISRITKLVGNDVINQAPDIGADLVGTDTILVDDGAAGTGRKSAISRLTKPLGLALINDQADIGAALTDADTMLVDDGGAGTGRKTSITRMRDYIGAGSTYKNIFVSASDMYPKVTAGSSVETAVELSSGASYRVLDFADGASRLVAQFVLAMPSDWDLGNIKFKVYMFAQAGTAAQTVSFSLAFKPIADGESLDDYFVGATYANGTYASVDKLMVCGPSGSTGSSGGVPVIGEMCTFVLRRETSSDTLAGTARVLGVEIQYYSNVSPAAW